MKLLNIVWKRSLSFNLLIFSEQKMLRVRDEEMGRSGARGRSLSRKGPGHHTEEEEDDDEEGFSESELELYEQYKAAGYRDLVSARASVSDQSAAVQTLPVWVTRLPV